MRIVDVVDVVDFVDGLRHDNISAVITSMRLMLTDLDNKTRL